MNRLSVFAFLTFFYFGIELGIGYWIQSLALQTDAYHMLSDTASALILIIANRYKTRSSNNEYTYGWVRAEILGSLWNAIFLIAICFLMILEAIQRCITPEHIENPKLLVIVASVGLAFNVIGLGLFGHSHHEHSHDEHSHHGHSHDEHSHDEHSHHGHSHTHDQHTHGHGLAIRSLLYHILGDLFVSVSVIVSGLVIWLTEWEYRYYLDPVISIVIALILLKSSIPIVSQSSRILMQAVHDKTILENLKRDILELSGVKSLHEFHIWSLDENRVIANVHVIVERDQDSQEIQTSIRKVFHLYGIHNTTIQMEWGESGQCQSQCEKECNHHRCCCETTPLIHSIQ